MRVERIQKILSAHGAASRREAEIMIKAGRVAVNGITATLGQSADSMRDAITIDGIKLAAKSDKVYIMLNKPRGYVTTMKDEHGRKTVAQLTANAGTRVYPVGRLDLDSEGLLILTNDGDFANAVMHPSYNLTKRYRVSVAGVGIEGKVSKLRDPMKIEDYTIKPVNVELLKLTDDGGIIEIEIKEGKNRQIRKMCGHYELEVKRLRRVAIGGLGLSGLKTGKWRYLTETEKRLIYDGR